VRLAFSEFRSHDATGDYPWIDVIDWHDTVPVEVYTSLAWDNLFDNRGSLQNISILDRVKACAQDLSKCVSGTDKGRLDEYLTSVREVEKRI
jgi:Protein of unknown function (DUF1552)